MKRTKLIFVKPKRELSHKRKELMKNRVISQKEEGKESLVYRRRHSLLCFLKKREKRRDWKQASHHPTAQHQHPQTK